MTPTLTHIALGVRDLDRTIAFYEKHVGLRVAHERDDGNRVVWLAERERDVDFVLVLFEVADAQRGSGTLQHLGFAVSSREEVDQAAAAGRADGIVVVEPIYAGPIVGYFCILEDPDGNRVEFSYGQPINPRDLPRDVPKDPSRGRSAGSSVTGASEGRKAKEPPAL
jgi:catechol 2,3-dioxygenase-like lactoylglutathione lyase family enzyme